MKNNNNYSSILKNFLYNFLLILLSAFLFALANPGFVFTQGCGVFGFIFLIPALYVIYRVKFRFVWLYGLIFGILSYFFYISWILKYAWFILAAVCLIYGVYLTITFVVLKLAMNLFLKEKNGVKKLIFNIMGVLTVSFLWVFYEYLTTLGFLGFSYGVTGYTQWKNHLLLQTASFGGVWFASFFCTVIAVCLSFYIIDFVNSRKIYGIKKAFLDAAVKNSLGFALIAGLSVFVIITGINKINAEKNRMSDSVKIAAVQNNADPWKGGVEAYIKSVELMESITNKAFKQNGNIDIVVWPETAVVPPLVYNYTEKRDYDRYQMIIKLLEFMQKKACTFVVGNQHTVVTEWHHRDDYNSALVFSKEKNNYNPPKPEVYKKIHLVPFTESFPYEDTFPMIYKMLIESDTHLWTPGKEYTVFSENGITFSTPICFEDSFGNECRKFLHNKQTKARMFINLSNDAWSHNDACQYQHLAMAVFRSAENRIPSVRSTASGITCFVDSAGIVTDKMASFEAGCLTGTVKVPQEGVESVYTKYGDWFAWICLVLAVFFCIIASGVERRSSKR